MSSRGKAGSQTDLQRLQSSARYVSSSRGGYEILDIWFVVCSGQGPSSLRWCISFEIPLLPIPDPRLIRNECRHGVKARSQEEDPRRVSRPKSAKAARLWYGRGPCEG